MISEKKMSRVKEMFFLPYISPMIYLIFKTRRNLWTFACKVSAKFAKKFKKSELLVSVLDFSLKKRAIALSDEATYCMKKTARWQSRAKLCVLAHHENEKVLRPKGDRE